MATFEDYAPTGRLTVAAISHDGTQLAYVDGSGKNFNLYVGPVEGPFAQVTQYTDASVRTIAWHPSGTAITFTADQDGDEAFQIFHLDLPTHTTTQLTDHPEAQYLLTTGAWSPDGSTLAYSGNYPDATKYAVSLYDPQTGAHRVISDVPRNAGMSCWSACGGYLGCVMSLGNTKSAPFIIDLATGTATTVNSAPAGRCAVVQVTDAQHAVLVSDYDREFMAVGTATMPGEQIDWLYESEWGVEPVLPLPQAGQFVIVTNVDGYRQVATLDSTTSTVTTCSELPAGLVSSVTLSKSGDVLACVVNAPQSPANVYLVQLATGTVTQVTKNAPRSAAVADLVAPELTETTTFDGHRLPMFVYRPAGPGPHPAVVSIHGGPQAQENPIYNPFYQLLLSRGIAVIAPNIRGSMGYGKSYTRLIERQWGHHDLKDFHTVRDHIRTLAWVDDDRVGVFGGSYGGFATLTCVSRMPNDWAAGVDIVGPSNLVSFCQSVPKTWHAIIKEWVGDFEADADLLMSRSPISYVADINAPLMVVQGAKDPRVVQAESDGIVAALRERGVEVRYDLYEDEGHGFTRETNHWQAHNDAADFFCTHLQVTT